MTIDREIEYIRQNQKYRRTIFNSIDYGFLMFPIAFIIIGLGGLLGLFPWTKNEQFILSPILLTIGIFLFFFFKNRIDHNSKYFELRTAQNQTKNIELTKETLEKDIDSRQIYIDEKNGIVNTTTGFGLTSWGETINVICFDNYVLINSRPHGYLTIYEDKMNIKRIKEGITRRIESPAHNSGS